MPFLRVVRDKRGYETTYLMHWFRDGQRQRSRILYVFRTPGGARVGRDALEPEVLRSIEAQYPDIEFDWKAVREQRQVVEPVPELRRRKKRQPEEAAAGRARAPAAAPREEAAPPAPVSPPVPSVIEGSTPDEQIAFLHVWHPALRERIVTRMSDPVRREALLALADRLNPAAWTDADQITVGLQQASEALERLSRVFAKRKRRSRRRRVASASPEREAVPASVEDTEGPPQDSTS